jgi:hypothetical protein
MKCFEINLLIVDYEKKQMRNVGQYFQQEKGSFQAARDTLKWVHLVMKARKEEHPELVVERLVVWSWNMCSPELSGDIKTKRSNNKVLNWTYENGILDMAPEFTEKQKRKIKGECRLLNKYRHVRSEVVIEEITEDIRCIAI